MTLASIELSPPRRTLLALTVALLVGQLLGASAHAPWWAGACAATAGAILTTCRPHHLWIAVCLCGVGIGMLQVRAALAPRLSADHVARIVDRPIVVDAEVRDSVRDGGGRLRLTLDVDTVIVNGAARTARGAVLVTIHAATQPWEPGDQLHAELRLRRPRNFGNPGELDYEALLARRGIYATGFAMNDRGWSRQAVPLDHQSLTMRWRSSIRRALSACLPPVAQRIMAALIIGDSAAMPTELWERYARTGVAHVLSISGLHIALVAAAATSISRWLMSRSAWLLLRTSVPKLSVAAAIVPVGIYGALAGGSAPTVRSIMVLLMFGVGLLVDRRRDWLTSLAAAALGISVVWPGAVFEIGFQLSFMSVLSITIGMQRFLTRWRRWEDAQLVRLRPDAWRFRAVRAAVFALGTTLCASLGTAPLTAFHFNQVSLITLIANLVVIPLLGMVPISAGLLGALLVPLAPEPAIALFRVGGVFITAADTIVALLAQVPGAAVRTVSPNLFELLLLYGVLGAVFVPARRVRLALFVLCAALLSVDVAYWSIERFWRRDLRITFLSVGHGDCAVVEMPGSTVIVIDGGGLGGNFDVGERIVAPYLWRRKIARVDKLVLSHADHDHYGGLAFIAREFTPDEIWWNGVDGDGRTLRAFWKAIEESGVRRVRVGFGFSAQFSGARLSASAPREGDAGSLNDRSLVLRLSYGPSAVLFTGDIEAEGERRLVDRSGNDVAATIIKAPHHGSRTSSSDILLRAVRPAVAVISAGYANRFRLPHPDVLARYHARGTSVWRTDLDGAVVVRMAPDGSITVSGSRSVYGKPLHIPTSTQSPRLTPLQGQD